jgi:hypothetical protein
MDKETKNEIEKLSKTYERKGRYKNEKGYIKYAAAAVDFEDKTGLVGVAGRYKMTGDRTHPEAEYDYRKAYQKYMLSIRCLEDNVEENPSKIKAAEFFVKKSPEALKRLNKDIDDLVGLNPELKGLKIDRKNFFECYHAIVGITSQYNVDDINLFCVGKLTGRKIKDEVYEKRLSDIKKKLGCGLGWTASEKTLQKIEKQAGILRTSTKNAILKKELVR